MVLERQGQMLETRSYDQQLFSDFLPKYACAFGFGGGFCLFLTCCPLFPQLFAFVSVTVAFRCLGSGELSYLISCAAPSTTGSQRLNEHYLRTCICWAAVIIKEHWPGFGTSLYSQKHIKRYRVLLVPEIFPY